MGPRVMLLDEITSALDPELVAEVLNIVRDLAAEGMTMLLATHEMGFAREVASKICFLCDGVVHEEGPPAEIFGAPRQERTRNFLTAHHRGWAAVVARSVRASTKWRSRFTRASFRTRANNAIQWWGSNCLRAENGDYVQT